MVESELCTYILHANFPETHWNERGLTTDTPGFDDRTNMVNAEGLPLYGYDFQSTGMAVQTETCICVIQEVEY